jgi:hypothetical protein
MPEPAQPVNQQRTPFERSRAAWKKQAKSAPEMRVSPLD